MKFSEAVLEGWSHQGSKQQSAATYQTIKTVLEDSSSPYYSKSFEVFLQGSYGNDTNIYADSDVDVVICLTSVYYDDLSWLEPSERSLYDSVTFGGGYSLAEFRTSVIDWLKQNFGNSVSVGNKAVFIQGNSNRRDADVLICAEHRLYSSYKAVHSSDYHQGIVFWPVGGGRIVNFPKQHRDNLSARNQVCYSRLKPLVRVVKNLRNRMQDDQVLAEGRAPSYFIEGLLWNMPYEHYQYSHRDTVDSFVEWVSGLDTSQLTCANGIHFLVRNDFPTSWKTDDFFAYRGALQAYWS
jgi:hypothetical protein